MKKILIFRTGSIGDTVITIPALKAVKQIFPESNLTYLTNKQKGDANNFVAKKILPVNLIDQWLEYPAPALKNLFKLLFILRQTKFDSMFYLMNRNRPPESVKRDIYFFRASGLSKIYGVDYLKRNFLSVSPPKPVRAVESEASYLFNCVAAEKINNAELDFVYDLELTANEEKEADCWLRDNCGGEYENKNILAVMPFSNWDSKNWDIRKFIETVQILIEKKNVFPIVFGGKNDRQKAGEMIASWKKGLNICGALGLRGDAAVLKRARLYLGTDTGTMHLAAAVGTPCVTIFAAADYPERWYPFGADNVNFRQRVECEGCFLPVCLNNKLCTELIDPQTVITECLLKLSND